MCSRYLVRHRVLLSPRYQFYQGEGREPGIMHKVMLSHFKSNKVTAKKPGSFCIALTGRAGEKESFRGSERPHIPVAEASCKPCAQGFDAPV